MPIRGCPRPSTGIGAAAPTGTALVGVTATTAVPPPLGAPAGSATAALRPERGSLTVSGMTALLSENPIECDCPFRPAEAAGRHAAGNDRPPTRCSPLPGLRLN